MKALVIAGANIRLMPYLFGYFEQLSKQQYEITLFYWDRDGLDDRPLPEDIKVFCFREIMKNDISKQAKLKYFIKFRRNASKVIKSQKYDRILVCDTQFAVLLSDILIKHYRRRYIFDIRDPSYEKISIYKKRVASVVLNSIATFISSNAYLEYLPKSDHIYPTHNINMKDIMNRDIRRTLPRKTDKIRISFWGCIRDTAINLSLIKELGNDNRFELHYYGTIEKTAQAVINYCRETQINNVYVYKEYLPDERYDFAKETDIIHNAYNNNNRGSNPSMGNKFYEGIIFYLPQFCTEGGYMGSEALKYGVGITIDPSTSFADKLYNYYNNIDWVDFEGKCDRCLETILQEVESSVNVLNSTLKLD